MREDEMYRELFEETLAEQEAAEARGEETVHRFLPFSNAIMFALVMDDEKLCRMLMQRLFPEREIEAIRFKGDNGLTETLDQIKRIREAARKGTAHQTLAQYETTLINSLHARSVRLDILFTDADGTWTDIEFQAVNKGNLPWRARFNLSSMTVKQLAKGQPYRELKPAIVIFICQFDYFKMGESLYDFTMFDEDKQLNLGDNSRILIVNTKCPKSKTPRELEAFFRYVNLAAEDVELLGESYESGDTFVDEINRRVCEFNAKEELKIMESLGEKLEREMTDQWQEGRKEGEAIGRRRGEKIGQRRGEELTLLENIRNLMESFSLTPEQAMNALKVSEEQRVELFKKLD